MSLFSDLYHSRATVDFRPSWRRTLRISAVVFVISLILLLVRGLDLSVDFDGGGVFEAPVAEGVGVAVDLVGVGDEGAKGVEQALSDHDR